jgi:DNA-binding XRE family transcriptional regulator
LYENILSINNGENEEYEKNIEFQLKIIEIIRQATKEYYQKAS